jgi:hypothetical protein
MNLRRGGAPASDENARTEPKLNKKERKAQRALERSAQADADGISDETKTSGNRFGRRRSFGER